MDYSWAFFIYTGMFRTEITITDSEYKIDLADSIFTIGSCFSTTIGRKLEDFKFNTLNNPFGITYNPHSIGKLIEQSISGLNPPDEYYLERDDLWFHHNYHSQICATSKDELQTILNHKTREAEGFLSKAQWVLITLGTAVVYELNGNTVSNCHKLPQKNFTKRLLSMEETKSHLNRCLSKLQDFNPNIHVVLTVSPVRHLSDTIPVNNRSKAILINAVHEVCDELDKVNYFPSYEIMMDDLRDYRFYKDDLIHPTTFAENYIWEKFQKCYFSDEVAQFVKEWNNILAGLNHKPFHPKSKKHQLFLKNLLEKLENLSDRVNVVAEIETVRSQLI